MAAQSLVTQRDSEHRGDMGFTTDENRAGRDRHFPVMSGT